MTFAYISEDDLHRNIVEQDNLLLRCEVSKSDAAVQWYKDGVEIKSSDNVLIETENFARRLILQSAQLSNSGTYTCRSGDNALIFKVNVRGKSNTSKRLYILYTFLYKYAYSQTYNGGKKYL